VDILPGKKRMRIDPRDPLLEKLRLAFDVRSPRSIFGRRRPFDHRLMLTLAMPQSICLSAPQIAARPGFSPSHWQSTPRAES
jgi:hypothetical protein